MSTVKKTDSMRIREVLRQRGASGDDWIMWIELAVIKRPTYGTNGGSPRPGPMEADMRG